MAVAPLKRLIVMCIAFTWPPLGQSQSTQISPTSPPKTNTMKQPTDANPQPATSANGPGPSLEFLEFLGEFETNDGQWHDPIKDLQDIEASSLQGEKIK